MKDRKILLGHVRKGDKFVPLYHPQESKYIICCDCNKPISVQGGPKANVVCLSCYQPENTNGK
jgi:hypothetical protein